MNELNLSLYKNGEQRIANNTSNIVLINIKILQMRLNNYYLHIS